MHLPRFVSLRARLLLVLLGLTALPALLIGGLAYLNARQTIESRVQARLNSVADLKKEQLTTWVTDRVADVHLLADNFLNEEHFTVILDPQADPELVAAFAGFLTDNLHSMQQTRAGYREIYFVDRQGRVILSTEPARVGAAAYAQPDIGRTLSSPTGQFIYDIHRAQADGSLEMAFGHVLRRVDLATNTVLPEVNGAVILRVAMDATVYPLIRDWPDRGATGETLLARADGEATLFLNPLRFDDAAALNLRVPQSSPDARPAHLAVAGQEGIIATTDYRGVPVLAAYRTIPQTQWGIVTKQNVDEAFAPVADLAVQVIAVTLLVLLAAAGAAALLSRALVRPLARLVSATQAVAAGHFDSELPPRRHDEIGQLTVAFQTMMTAVRDREVALRAHSEELATLFDLSQTLLGTLDAATLLESALRQAVAGTNSQAGAILVTEPNHQEITVRAAVGFPAALVGQRFPIDANTAPGYALLSRQPISSADLAEETRFSVPAIVHAAGVRANLAVPMIIDGQAVGALVVDTLAPRAYTVRETRIAQAIANQTAVALERARLFSDLRDSYDHTLDALVAALDARDKETEGHSRRVVAYTLALARRLNVADHELVTIRRGALLHDIGKIGIPDAILRKPGPLSEEEWIVMRRHPEWGQQILSAIAFLETAAQIVQAHHERWDGRGYPRGLAGEAIPFGARIFAVADTLDAITSDRPYRQAKPYAVAHAEIEAGRGTQFDPQVVEAFLQISEAEWRHIREDLRRLPRATGPLALETEPVGSAFDLEALNRLMTAVSGSLNLDTILQEAARTAVETFGAAACGLFLYQPHDDTLSLAAGHGLPEVLQLRFGRMAVKGFHNEAVVREACSQLHADIAEIPEFVQLGLPKSWPDVGAYLCIPLTAKGDVLGVMGLFSRRPRMFSEREQTVYQTIGEQVGLAIANARLHETVQQLALTDGLTGAYNRRYLGDFLAQELERSARYRHSLSLIMLDLDYFKAYNDAHGHPAGDEALRQVVTLLGRDLRVVDLLARYGGEEFAVVLPETDAAGAYAAAEKMRRLLAGHAFPNGRLTASLGVASTGDGQVASPAALIEMSDQALYAAKDRGRNQTCMWEPALTTSPRQTAAQLKP